MKIVTPREKKSATTDFASVPRSVEILAPAPASTIKRSRRRRSRLLLLLISTLGAVLCAGPSCSSVPADCAFTCPDGACGEGLYCSAEGFCVREGSTASCVDAVAGIGGDGGGDHSFGGAGDSGAPGGGEAGAGQQGGSAGLGDAGAGGLAGGSAASAGGGGSPVCDGEALRVSLRLPEDREFLCSNELSPITLLVEGGVPPYTWSLRDSPDFSLVTQGDSEAELELQHTASPSEYLLEAGVSDSCGNDTSGEFTIEVRTTPKLLSAPLPNACATRLYAAPLALTSWMEGVTWAAEGLPRGVQMDASAGLITGTFQEVRDFPLEVTVSNDCGSSAPESRTVHVVEPLAGCPIQPSSSNRFGTLPVPCEGAPYSADIDFLEPVSCSIFERPPGFELTRCRTDGVTLSGTPSGPGNLIISVNDATGTQTVAGFSFEPRRACWFAYVSDDEESALHILDPLLFDEVSGELHARPGVASFAFAPDGRFLAYVAQGDLVRELTVVELATWKERVVPLDGNVFHYAWSQSGFLAVAFGGEGPSQLGGANVAELDWESGAELVALEPVAANVSSDLTWIGDEFVVYLSTDQNVDGRLLSLARRSSAEDAFLEPFVAGPVYDVPKLQPTSDGVFVTDWPTTSGGSQPQARVRLDYVVPTHDPFVRHQLHSHATDEVVAPSGNYTGRSTGSTFAAFLPTESTFDMAFPPTFERMPCRKVLAWSRDGERIACANDTSVAGKGELRFFALGDDEIEGHVVPGPADHEVAGYHLARRAFSPNGAWFGYLMEDGLFLAAPGEPSRLAERVTAGIDAVDLEFSPDGGVVLVQPPANAELFVISTKNTENETSYGPASVQACVEEFLRAPQQWCGSERASANFAWAPFGRVVAYETVAGELVVVDLSNTDGGELEPVLAARAKSFSFQPSTDSQRYPGE
jgi:hypothetical protein